MKGSVKIIKTFQGRDEVLFEEDNMIVDGARQNIVDMLSHTPNPDASIAGDAVSGFQILGWSLSPSKDYYNQRDSRYWYTSSLNDSSGSVWSLVTPSEKNYPCLENLSSGTRHNQFAYIGSKDLDISEWEIDSYNDGRLTESEVVFASGRRKAYRFEYEKGDARVVLRKRVGVTLGSEYTFQYEGRASTNTFAQFRLGRGTEDRILEYYDFNSQTFEEPGLARSIPSLRFDCSSHFASNSLRFVVKGNEVDQSFEYDNYFIELVLPSYGYEQTDFRSWKEGENPYIELVRAEFLSGKDYILKNPNFLETQSKFLNNNFKYSTYYTGEEVSNPQSCIEAGIVKLLAWEDNSKARFDDDPADNLSASGYVLKYDKDYAAKGNGQAWSSVVGTEGVLLHTSSSDWQSVGFAGISQTRTLSVENLFESPNFDIATKLDDAYGLEDCNKTYWLEFDVLPKGTGTAGAIQVKIERLQDGTTYKGTSVPSDPNTNLWTPLVDTSFSIGVTKDQWNKVSLPVVFDAESTGQYRVSLYAQGRTDQAGYIDYFIKDFSFGDLVGWEVFPLGFSSLATIGRTNTQFRGLTSALQFSAAGAFASNSGYSLFSSLITNTKRAKRNQIVTRFTGVQPQKCYNVAVKWSAASTPSVDISLKAFAKSKNRNLLSNWLVDSAVYSGSTVSPLNPLFSGTNSRRLYYPQGVKALTDETTTAHDQCVEVKPGEAISERFRVNDLTLAKFSVESLQRGAYPGYFAISAVPQVAGDRSYIFNWNSDSWELVENQNTSFGSNNATSSNYFLPIQNTNRSKFQAIEERLLAFRGSTFGFLSKSNLAPNGTGLGKRGDYVFDAVLYGPETGQHSIFYKNVKLLHKTSRHDIRDAYKQLYYDFDNRTWVPEVKTHRVDKSGMSKTICNMHMAGLQEDTVYQLNISDSTGTSFDLNEVSLCDITYAGNSGEEGYVRNKDVFTSEPYSRRDYINHKGFTLRQENTAVLSVPYLSSVNNVSNYGYEPIPIVLGEQLPAKEASDAPIDVFAASGYLGAQNKHTPVFSFSFTPAQYGLKPGEVVAFQPTIALKTGTTANAFFIGLANDGGKQYSYIPEKRVWNEGYNFRTTQVSVLGQSSQLAGYSQSDVYNYSYPTFKFTVPSISENGSVIVNLNVRGIGAATNTTAVLKELQMFRVIEKGANYRRKGDSFLFPEFPTPQDRSVQSKGEVGDNDELGHIMNRINFFDVSAGVIPGGIQTLIARGSAGIASETGERSFFEATDKGGYLPSGGMYFPPGTFGSDTSSFLNGKLNSWGVVNHDGIIYRHPKLTPLNASISEASAGFIVSSYTPPATQIPTVRYVLRLHRDDWKFIDYYMGGIGAMGLWSIDRLKTYKKGVSKLFNLAANAFTATSPESLYIHDYSQQPVFRLNAKKVMFPPGLHIDYSTTEYVTIIWDIQY